MSNQIKPSNISIDKDSTIIDRALNELGKATDADVDLFN
jgi:hypothetical protein